MERGGGVFCVCLLIASSRHDSCRRAVSTVAHNYLYPLSGKRPCVVTENCLIIMCWTKCPRSHQPHSAPSSGKCSKWRKHDTWHNCLQLRPFAFPAIELPASSFLGHVQSSHTVLSSSNGDLIIRHNNEYLRWQVHRRYSISFASHSSFMVGSIKLCLHIHTSTHVDKAIYAIRLRCESSFFSCDVCIVYDEREMRVDRQSLPASNTWSHDNWGFNGISIGVSYECRRRKVD